MEVGQNSAGFAFPIDRSAMPRPGKSSISALLDNEEDNMDEDDPLVSLLAAAATTKYQPVTPVGGRTASDMESSASGSEDSDNDSGGDFDGTDDSAIDGLGLPRNTRKKRKRDPERGAGSRKTRPSWRQEYEPRERLFSPPITKKIRANRREPLESELNGSGKKSKQNRRALEWFFDLIKTDPAESFVTWQGTKGHFVIHDTDKLLASFQDFRKKDDYKLENIVHNFLRPYNMDEVHGEKRLRDGNVYISLDTETLPDGDEASVFRPSNRMHLASMIHRGTGIPQKRYILTQGNTTVISNTPHNVSNGAPAGSIGQLSTPLHRSTRAATKVADAIEHGVIHMPHPESLVKMEQQSPMTQHTSQPQHQHMHAIAIHPIHHPILVQAPFLVQPRSELDGLRPDFFLPQTINAIVSTKWVTLDDSRKDLDLVLLDAFRAWAQNRHLRQHMK